MDQDGERDPAEVVEFGPKRPLLRARWLLIAAVLLAAVVAVQVAQRNPSSQPTPPTSATTPTARPDSTVSNPSVVDSRPSITVVGHRLLDVTGDWDLFVRGTNEVVRIQPAAGRITRTRLPALQSTGPVSFLAVAGGVIVRPLDYVPGYLVPDGAPARPLRAGLSQGGPVFPGPDPAHAWVQDTADGSRLRLVRLDGSAAAATIRVPMTAQWPIASDGAGYVILRGTGGDYTARPRGLRRITPGVVVAGGPTGWLATECDDQARCVPVVIDRRTGGRRTLAGSPIKTDEPPGVISPDGRVAAFVHRLRGGPPSVHLVELVTGADHRVAVQLRSDRYDMGMAWSPDSRWLFVVSANGLAVVDPHTRTVRELGLDLPRIDQVAVRR